MVYDRHGQSLSIEKEYGARGSQALELRTDALGTQLARESDIPDSAVMDAQSRTLRTDEVADAGSAFLQSHPDNSLRMTAMRMYLTINRLRDGQNQNTRGFDLADFKLDQLRPNSLRLRWSRANALG